MRLLTTLAAVFFSGMVLATPLHNIVVFGDSLSDNGNLYVLMKEQLPSSPPYFKGRFTNGMVWIEHLAASYFPKNPESHLLDYAYGGAAVSEEGDDEVLFTLRREINSYLLAHHDQASKDSLFVMLIGSNNYIMSPLSEAEKTLQEVQEGVKHGLQRLVEKGAKHILVVNLPDLGKTPMAIEIDSVAAMNYFARKHNDLLSEMLDEFRQQYPEVEWLHFDLYQAFDEVVLNPQHYGFTNTTGTCITFSKNTAAKKSILKMAAAAKTKVKQDACEGYLFFDLIHPTAKTHKILGERAKALLDGSGLVFSG